MLRFMGSGAPWNLWLRDRLRCRQRTKIATTPAKTNPPATALPTAIAVIRLLVLLLALTLVSNDAVVIAVVVVTEIVGVGGRTVTLLGLVMDDPEGALSGIVYL
jgi:hypothetical protein